MNAKDTILEFRAKHNGRNQSDATMILNAARLDIIFSSLVNEKTIKLTGNRITAAFVRPATINFADTLAKTINQKMMMRGIIVNVEILFGMSIEITWE